MNIKTTLFAMIFLSITAYASDIKTNEQIAKEGAAMVNGSNLRIHGMQKSQCKYFNFTNGELEACYKGYDQADKNLKSPASK